MLRGNSTANFIRYNVSGIYAKRFEYSIQCVTFKKIMTTFTIKYYWIKYNIITLIRRLKADFGTKSKYPC